jgi:hypothetical protein
MPGQTYSPRIVGTQRADLYSIDTLLASPQLAGKKDEALVLAIYDYFTSTIDGTYHYWSPDETRGIPRQRNRVDDPIKLINCYGWMLCGQHAALQFCIYKAAGLRGRQYSQPGHNLCEVFYDGRWHALDVDMWTWFRTPEGHIASAAELQANPHALIVDNKNKSNPCDLPDRALKDYADMYAQGHREGPFEKNVQPPHSTRGHTMDFHLCPGETLIRSQANEGRFLMPQEWKRSMQKYVKEWRGHPRERYEPLRTFGNGRWIYEPNLDAAFADVEAGAWERSGLTQDANGLVGSGSITFRIQSPYPFTGKPDWQAELIAYSDGGWISAAGSGDVRIEVNDAEGHWTVLSSPLGKPVDVTNLLASRYHCLVRVTLGSGARLTHFKFDSYIMTAPASLPRPVEGENKLELRCRDKHGLCSVPWTQQIDFRADADVRSQFQSIENAEIKTYVPGWQCIAPKGSDPIQVVARFDAPAGRKFAWGYAEASLRERTVGSAPQSGTMEWSADGKSWQPLDRVELTDTPQQWDCSIDGEFKTPDPVPSFWIRITSPTALSRIEFRGHLLEKSDEKQQLRIVHRWQEDGGAREFIAPAGAERYSISCGKNPRLHSIEMHSPSLTRG